MEELIRISRLERTQILGAAFMMETLANLSGEIKRENRVRMVELAEQLRKIANKPPEKQK